MNVLVQFATIAYSMYYLFTTMITPFGMKALRI